MYLAEELQLSNKKLDEDEFLEVSPLSIEQAMDFIYQGEITDVKTIIGIFWLEKFLSDNNKI